MTKPPISESKSKKKKKTQSKGKNVASSNWFNLQKTLKTQNSEPVPHRKKRQKLDSGKSKDDPSSVYTSASSSSLAPPPVSDHAGSSTSSPLNNLGLGRYLALDCEMVGVGINASQSSLARVSLVNYHGAVILDEYVRQRERVVDYRTPWSGITPSDMINAKPFEEVQKTVNDLLDGRILIGHAIHHDLKALLLSHPIRQTRDTQFYAYKFALSKSRHISLKNLAKQELGIDIQDGEHSSVVDAKATMAIYRKHKADWERAGGISQMRGPKRKRSMQTPETNGLLGRKDEGGFSEVEGEE